METSVGRIPSVFVSSTCYDLSLIRVELYNFIREELGYNTIMSEYNSFPVNPNINPIDNCKVTVRDEVDIFVLIIGCRLGYVTESGKSITNLEYLNAKARGIPIYIFVDEKIVNALSLWRANKSGDFSSIVDNADLFKFLDEIMCGDQKWIFKFNNISDIITTLKRQFGYLLFDSLKLRQKLNVTPTSMKLKELDGVSLYIAIEKPFGWEYILLGLLIERRFSSLQDLRRDLKYGISLTKVRDISGIDEFMNFTTEKSNELLTWISNLSILVNGIMSNAVGEEGKEGNIDEIIYAANKIGDIYENIIKSSLDFQATKIHEDFEGLKIAMLNVYKTPLDDLDGYCTKFKVAIEEIKKVDVKSEGELDLDLTLTLNSDLTEYDREYDILCRKYNIYIEEENEKFM